MNALDVGLLILFVAGAGVGLARGLVRIVIGILSLVVAFVLASRCQDGIAETMIARHVSATPAHVAAYLAVFLGTLIAGGLVAWVVGKILKLAMLSWADRLAGGALGLVGAALAAAFLVHPLIATSRGGSHLLAESKLAPYVTVIADLCNTVAPDSVARRYQEGVASLRKIWRGDAAAR